MTYKAPQLFKYDEKSGIPHTNIKEMLMGLLTLAMIVQIVLAIKEKYGSVTT